MVQAVDAAVRIYEDAPTTGVSVEAAGAEVWLGADDWAEAFAAPGAQTPHNEAREQIWDELVAIVVDRLDDEDVTPEQVSSELRRNEQLVTVLNRAWPLIEPTDLVGDLWSVPAYLRMCAPWLDVADVRRLQRADAQAWTDADLPLLDAARFRLGDPEAGRRLRQREAVRAAEREQMDRVVDDLIATDDSEMMIMSMLKGQDLQAALVDDASVADAEPDQLTGPFAHIVVDEAQELTDAEWQMLERRCPSRSLTVVGDRAQARHGFAESWAERLARVSLDQVRVSTLGINYRTPEEVMTEAEPVIRAVLPDANVPTSIRSTGAPVEHRPLRELGSILDAWLAHDGEGVACVIGLDDPGLSADPSRVRFLTPVLAKGLEFDLVVLVDPSGFGEGIEGAVDRYVAMTRATQRLVVLTSG
jgi:superfamily I DNA/RNA helicase